MSKRPGGMPVLSSDRNPQKQEVEPLNNSSVSRTLSTNRSGLQDIWNAYMLKGTLYSPNDIPLCPTTAVSLPSRLISYDEAKTLHNKEMQRGNKDYHVDAFIHFYIDDQKFDGKRTSIWLYPEKSLEILRHFSGIIAPDFSTYADFPEPLKRWNFFRMNAFGYWVGSLGIAVISNCRWGTEETWSYCFDGNPRNDMVAVGTVASGIRLLRNRPLFENGLYEMVAVLHPHTIIVYGSANYACFDNLRAKGIRIIVYPGRTSEAFAGRKLHE